MWAEAYVQYAVRILLYNSCRGVMFFGRGCALVRIRVSIEFEKEKKIYIFQKRKLGKFIIYICLLTIYKIYPKFEYNLNDILYKNIPDSAESKLSAVRDSMSQWDRAAFVTKLYEFFITDKKKKLGI